MLALFVLDGSGRAVLASAGVEANFNVTPTWNRP
jgi:hypothetical protein